MNAYQFFSSPSKLYPRLDPEAWDYDGLRFLALCYRTSRAVLAQRGLLHLGQSIAEAEGLEGGLRKEVPIPSGPLQGCSVPVLPFEGMSEEKTKELSTMHGFIALQIGSDPDDACLEGFRADNIGWSFPNVDQLLDFEQVLLETSGSALRRKGRETAIRVLEGRLGRLGRLERADFMALPYAWARQMQEPRTEDERALQVARLEDILRRARRSLDLRVELAAAREIGSIQGLRFQDDGKEHREVMAILSQPRRKNPPLLE